MVRNTRLQYIVVRNTRQQTKKNRLQKAAVRKIRI